MQAGVCKYDRAHFVRACPYVSISALKCKSSMCVSCLVHKKKVCLECRVIRVCQFYLSQLGMSVGTHSHPLIPAADVTHLAYLSGIPVMMGSEAARQLAGQGPVQRCGDLHLVACKQRGESGDSVNGGAAQRTLCNNATAQRAWLHAPLPHTLAPWWHAHISHR